MDERTALLAMSLVPGIGSGRIHKLLAAFDGSAVQAWQSRAAWSQRAALPDNIVQQALSLPTEAIDRARRRLDELQADIIVQSDPRYPPGLLHVSGPTPVLFVRGQLPRDYRRCVAIVGTRRPSASGERTSYELASHLAAVGVCVVSGLALGIDGAAHRGALQTGGITVAVLGCGLDCAYPRKHAELMEEIAATGAVVTEYTFGTEPLPRHFPARNRIIAGLSAGVVLVESGRTGGALHTVDYALDAGRDVMAVPGDVHRWQSEGPNQLLRDGGTLVRHAADVLHVLGYTSVPKVDGGRPFQDDVNAGDRKSRGAAFVVPDTTDRIVAFLRAEGAQSADEVGLRLALPTREVAAALTWLEVTGRIVRVPGGRFAAAG